MSKNQIIVIAGDSWGCGEWGVDNKTYQLQHGGLATYLKESGRHVVNLSKPGGSNIFIANCIDNFLSLSTHLDIGGAFVFQTEWPRDLLPENENTSKFDLNYGYQELKNRLISKFYYKLSQIAQKNKVPIYIIGGCSDTIWSDNFTQEYPGLEIICQSLTNLLLCNDHRISNAVHSNMGANLEKIIKQLKQTLSTEDLKLMLSDIDLGQQRYSTWGFEKTFFWPDGGHANRAGHYILYEFLKSKIPNL